MGPGTTTGPELSDEVALPRTEASEFVARPRSEGPDPLETLSETILARTELATEQRLGRHRWWRDQLRRRMLAAADLLVAAGIGSAVILGSGQSLLWVLAIVPSALLAAKLLGLYDFDHRVIRHLTVDELPTLAAWAG